jgi:hypothetical protein
MLAALCDDCVLIASDSQVIELVDNAQMTSTDDKLWPVEGCPLVWGYVGSASIGGELQRWIDKAGIATCKTWEALRDLVAPKLAALNAQRLQRAKDAGSNSVNQDATGAVFAGYVGGEALALLIDPTGDTQFERAICWDGLEEAKRNAAIAHRILESLESPFIRNERTVKALVTSVVSVTLGVEAPIQMWKITPTGAELVQART